MRSGHRLSGRDIAGRAGRDDRHDDARARTGTGSRAGPGARPGPGAWAGRTRWRRRGTRRRSSRGSSPEPDGGRAPDGHRADHRTRHAVRIGAVAGARQGSGELQVRSEGVLRFRNGERTTLQDAHRRPQAVEQFKVQRDGPRGTDASERFGAHVRNDIDLHDDVGPCRRGYFGRRPAAGHRCQSRTIPGFSGGKCADQRNHRPGWRAGEIEGPEQPVRRPHREKDGAGRNVGNRRHADRVSAFPHGFQNAGHAADLRRLHADVQRFGDPSGRCADDPRPDDARSVQRQHHNAAGWRCARRPIPCL